jgi:chromosomal replication initiation ATPase DnaA
MKLTLTNERFDSAVQEAARIFEIERAALMARRRTRAVIPARLALYAALYDGCNTTFEEIAWFLNRDHTTVIYGVNRARELAAQDADYARAVEQIKAAVQDA